MAATLAAPLHGQADPFAWIAELGPRTQPSSIGAWDEQHAAELVIANRIREFIKESPESPTLTERNMFGHTPLMQASVNGYAEIVDALLDADTVLATINNSDKSGATAWALAQFARPLSLGVCHPQMLAPGNAAVLQPYIDRTVYFSDRQPQPFERIRQRLEAAGARQDITSAKAAWRLTCPGQSDAMLRRLDNEPGLLEAVLQESKSWLAQAASLLSTPLKLKAVQNPVLPTARATKQEAQNGRLMVCQLMARVSAPEHVSWKGTVTLHLVAEIQAGRVVVAQLTIAPRNIPLRDEAILRHRLMEALAKYRCAGDFQFEQQFQFNFS